MGEDKKESPLERLAGWKERVEALCGLLERMHPLLYPERSIAELAGWKELNGRPLERLAKDGEPWLVATLFGPTGAGKSTLFHLLTGVNVPAGDAVRPMTFNPLVAVPESFTDTQRLAELFPFRELAPLEDVAVLRDRGVSREVLFWTRYRPQWEGEGVRVVLADVPDFDTIYRTNWEKAEDMMRRAEVVLFAMYPAAYMDASVLRHLEQCCAHAGAMVILLNKCEDENQVEAVWKDLIGKVSEEEEFARFREGRRQDGLRWSEFLAGAPVYYSLRQRGPVLESWKPLQGPGISLLETLAGFNGVRVLVASLAEDLQVALSSGHQLLHELERKERALRERVEIAGKHLEHAATVVSGTCFPAGRVTQLVLETARGYRPGWVRFLTGPLAAAGLMFRRSRSALASWWGGKAKPLEELEKKRVDEVLDQLLTAWRADLPEAELSMERCRAAREGLMARMELPEAGDSWEAAVKEQVKRWAEKNRVRTSVLGTLNDLLVVLGGAAVGLDLLVTGGQSVLWGSVLVGKLGLVGAAGAGGAAAGAFLQLFERAGLRGVVEVADAAWREQRTAEIKEYLRRELAEGLFLKDWQEQLDQVEKFDRAGARAVLDEIEGMLAQNRKGQS